MSVEKFEILILSNLGRIRRNDFCKNTYDDKSYDRIRIWNNTE